MRSEGTYGFLFNTSANDDDYPAQPISPVAAGAMTVQTTASADLDIGDYIIIYTGNVVVSAGPPGAPIGNPDAEINLVTGVNGSTVTLAWPLAKTYAIERFNVGEDMTTGITAIGHLGATAPLALRKIDPATGVTFDGITVDHRGSQAFLAGHQVVNLTVADIDATCTDSHFMSLSGWTGEMRDSTVHLEATGSASANPQWFAVAYGARDVALRRCTLTADHVGLVHVHEGPSDITIEDTDITNAPGWVTNNSAVLSLRARGYRIVLDDVDVTNAPELPGGSCLRVDEGISGSATGCTFIGGDEEIINESDQFTIT